MEIKTDRKKYIAAHTHHANPDIGCLDHIWCFLFHFPPWFFPCCFHFFSSLLRVFFSNGFLFAFHRSFFFLVFRVFLIFPSGEAQHINWANCFLQICDRRCIVAKIAFIPDCKYLRVLWVFRIRKTTNEKHRGILSFQRQQPKKKEKKNTNKQTNRQVFLWSRGTVQPTWKLNKKLDSVPLNRLFNVAKLWDKLLRKILWPRPLVGELRGQNESSVSLASPSSLKFLTRSFCNYLFPKFLSIESQFV